MSTPSSIPVVPKQDPKSAAKLALEAAFLRDEDAAEQIAAKAADSVWAYSCDRVPPKARKHFGIFFVKDPRNQLVFGPGDWYAVYHDNREAFDFELHDIVCQQCYAERGERVPLRVSEAPPPSRKAGVHFRISESWMQRFGHEVKRAELDEWLAKKKRPSAAKAGSDAGSKQLA